jgi:hypothetical protein
MATHAIPAQESTAAAKPGIADSYDSLLADVMCEMTPELSKMPRQERDEAVGEIHTIAENVRKRQA